MAKHGNLGILIIYIISKFALKHKCDGQSIVVVQFKLARVVDHVEPSKK